MVVWSGSNVGSVKATARGVWPHGTQQATARGTRVTQKACGVRVVPVRRGRPNVAVKNTATGRHSNGQR